MLEYINIHNIDHRILKRAAGLLENDGLVAYPTDTNWSIGCCIHSKIGIEKLKALKGTSGFTPSLICSEISQISDFVELQNAPFRLLKQKLPGPFVFVFQPMGNLDKKLGMKRLELGVRIPDHPVPRALVETLGKPLFSITASRKMTQEEWWDQAFAEEFLMEYGYEVEEITGVDLVLDGGEPLPKVLSTVVSMISGSPEILRQGIGNL